MGIVTVSIKLISLNDSKRYYVGDFLVDSGANYTAVPEKVWKYLKIKPEREQSFALADGTIIKRKIGNAYAEFQGIKSTTPIVLGEKNDSFLLGVVTLEELGLVLDPFKRKLHAAKLIL